MNTNYKLTNEKYRQLRLPITNNFKQKSIEDENKTVLDMSGVGTKSKSIIAMSIMQFYSGILADANGHSKEKLFWMEQLVAQDPETEEYIWLLQTPALSYGGQVLYIDDDFNWVYFLIDNTEDKTPMLGKVSREEGERLFALYRETEVTDMNKDKRYSDEVTKQMLEMAQKMNNTSSQPTSSILRK